MNEVSRECPTAFQLAGEACCFFLLSMLLFAASDALFEVAPAYATFEFCQYAEIGKNLAESGEFRTRLMEPMALAYSDAHALQPGPPWPVLNRFPFPCLVIAGLIKLFGATNSIVAASNGIAISILAAQIYVLASLWLGRRWAIFAIGLFLPNPSFYGYFLMMGTPDIWFAVFFFVQLLAFLKVATEPKNRAWAVMFGVLTGLSYLARFNVIIFVAVQIAYLVYRRQLRNIILAGISATILLIPLFVYNYRSFGTPVVSVYSSWNLLDEIGKYNVEPWLYYDQPQVLFVVTDRIAAVLQKTIRNLGTIVPFRIWTLWHLYLLLPLTFLSVCLIKHSLLRKWFGWAIVLFFFQLVVFSGMRLELETRLSPFHGRYFFWFAAPALLAAVTVLKELTLRYRWGRYCTVAILISQWALYGHTWSAWGHQNYEAKVFGYNFGVDPIHQAVGEIAGKDRVVAATHPQILVWYNGCTAISLPADPNQVSLINQSSPTPIDYLFIYMELVAVEVDPRWTAFLNEDLEPHSPWVQKILQEYEYSLDPRFTRPLGYVLLRRRGVPKSELEQFHQRGN